MTGQDQLVHEFRMMMQSHIDTHHASVGVLPTDMCNDMSAPGELPLPDPPEYIMDFLNKIKWLDFRLLRAIQCIHSEKLDCIEEAIDLLQEYVLTRIQNDGWDRLRHMGISDACAATEHAEDSGARQNLTGPTRG